MSKLTDEEKRFKKKAFKVIKNIDEKIELTIHEKISKLLDKQMKVLEEEVNLLRFKLAHNKLSKSELQTVYEQLKESFTISEE